MPTASSFGELHAMLLQAMAAAMQQAHSTIESDLREAVESFYAGGTPVMYQRTHALGDTPEVTGISGGGAELSFEAKLNQDGGYSTGSSPSMAQVLDLANYGIPFPTRGGGVAHPVVGAGGFWERAESKMQSDLDSAMASQFG